MLFARLLPLRVLTFRVAFTLATWVTSLAATLAEPHCRAEEMADLVLTGGKLVTVDDQCPTAEAIAVRGDRIVAVGTSAEIAPLIGPHTNVIQLAGKLAIPGFVEGHGHFVGLGQSKMILDLADAQTWDEIVQQVATAARNTPPGIWIVGRGWHQSKWTTRPQPSVEGTPTHEAISKQTPAHPVLLTHASGHMCIVNAQAMQLAGLDKQTQSPAGGEILHDPAGNPTGVLRENAMAIVSRVYERQQQQRSAAQEQSDLLTAIRLASDECLQYGVTSFHDAGNSLAVVDTYKDLAEQRQLDVRLWVMLGEATAVLERQLDRYRMIGYGDNHLTVRAIKRLADGALGSHGAWLLQPYDDLPASRGLNTLAMEDLQRTADLAIELDYQLCVHAIGDRANREVLDLYERTFNRHPQRHNLRWRIEHAQHLDPVDIPRFAELGVIAAMQAVHATSDGPFVVARLGERRAQAGAYAWQSLLTTGAVVTNGTDVPVERVDPLAGFYAAITRKMSNGVAFFPQQCMTRQQALRSYTLSAAFSAFEEDIKGSLTPGKLADITVLSQDIMTVPEEAVRETKVVMTIVGGKILYERKDPPPSGGETR